MADRDNSMDDSMGGSDPNRLRQIRHDYRDLITKINNQGGDTESLTEVLTTADKLYEEVLKNKSAREAALDAVLLRTASTVTYQHAQKLIVDNKFEPNVFSEKLVTLLTGRRAVAGGNNNQRVPTIPKDAWTRFGKDVFGCYRRTPPFHFMLGSFDRGPPVRKVRPPTSKEQQKQDGPTVRPTAIENTGKSQQEVTTEEVERMLGILKQLTITDEGEAEPISYFDFVINPHSFSHTIENIFHMSFLVKDGYVRIELDADGLPVILCADPYDPVKHKKEIPRKQLVLGLDMEEWQEIVEAFDITEPAIPPRVQTDNDRHGQENGTMERR